MYNIGLGGLFIAIILILSYFGLDAYTRHGDKIIVPDVIGSKPFEAEAKLSEMGLRIKIIDTVYLEKMKPGVIVEQLPLANEDVKSGRILYLTVNATSRPRISMPRLTDCSFNLAKALLKNAGLILGKTTFEYAEYGNNLVIGQKVGGRSIEAGQKVLKGTTVDLIVIDTELYPSSDSTSNASEMPVPEEE